MWDEPYEFIKEENEKFIKSVFVDDTFIDCGLNLVIYYDNRGRIIYSKAFDLEKKEEVPIPQIFYKINQNDPLLNHADREDSLNGIILLPEAPMLISSTPISSGKENGKILGTLVFGRYLYKEDVEVLAEKTHLPVKVYEFGEIPDEIDYVVPHLSEESPIFLETLERDSMAGFAMVNDIYGKPALLLRVDVPRNIYNEGQATITYFLLVLTGISLIFVLIFWILFKKYVISEEIQREAIEQLVTNLCQFDSSADRLRNPLAVIMSALELRDELGTEKVLETIDKQVKRIKDELDELRKEELKTYNLTKDVLKDF